MKYKGLILIILITIAAVTLLFLPAKKGYEEIAEVGSPAPDFELVDSKGKLWKLSEHKGKVVFINFWATWCKVCKSEIPYKESLNKKMQGKPFQMFGILFRDDPGNLIPFFKDQTVSIPTLISPDNKAAVLYGTTGVPETFIIDKDGIIREKIVGPRVWDSDDNISMIEKWL
jgi:peroxiredoxin